MHVTTGRAPLVYKLHCIHAMPSVGAHMCSMESSMCGNHQSKDCTAICSPTPMVPAAECCEVLSSLCGTQLERSW
jgi:hypothetical protein